ncbi:MAG: acyloxyacyl hydrolase [Chitinophagaceae bacterium]
MTLTENYNSPGLTRLACFLIAFAGLPLVISAQTVPRKQNDISLGAGFYRGSFITTVPKAAYVRDSYASFGEVYISFQTKGSRDWQLYHHYPSWGFSFLYGNTGSRKYIGNLAALYVFLDLPLLKKNRYALSLKAGAGPGLINKPYDIETNPKNTMIGTRLNAFINAVIKNEYQITDHLSANAGISFMHLSNGGTTLPNLGLNTPGLNAGFSYSLRPRQTERSHLSPAPFHRQWLFRAQTSVAIRQASRVGGNHYIINLVQGDAGIRTAPNHYFGMGIQLAYNRSLDYRPLETPLDPPNVKKFQAGVYGSYEHYFGRLSFPFQVGFYLYNKNLYPVIFQQYGARLRVTRHWSASVMLKSHLGKADFIHTGIDYKF